ncbi:hypothetical protein M409DRAFT_18719 [Zasmidium cellare ATCC 36951]|uniref:Uncharacterized protein n=1 Tax=Zasmidium cellare ATCC 36951 TaxID=1080233 RepID=A0A6A6CU09_ZASCE|nr:uncharacterized protein M409DRAFT_18719 [Zasmidium cellare ATCC 36951]KAF2170747.1 hypothetical protein M409DRAFT_18719 [Zasmidium cellare ATCC 36951]
MAALQQVMTDGMAMQQLAQLMGGQGGGQQDPYGGMYGGMGGGGQNPYGGMYGGQGGQGQGGQGGGVKDYRDMPYLNT